MLPGPLHKVNLSYGAGAQAGRLCLGRPVFASDLTLNHVAYTDPERLNTWLA